MFFLDEYKKLRLPRGPGAQKCPNSIQDSDDARVSEPNSDPQSQRSNISGPGSSAARLGTTQQIAAMHMFAPMGTTCVASTLLISRPLFCASTRLRSAELASQCLPPTHGQMRSQHPASFSACARTCGSEVCVPSTMPRSVCSTLAFPELSEYATRPRLCAAAEIGRAFCGP